MRRPQVLGFQGSGGDGSAKPRVALHGAADLPSRQDTGPILVAVDGQANGWDALEWAAAEADARQCSLRVVHAITWRPLLTLDELGCLSVNQLEEAAAAAAELVINEAASRARTVAPALHITTHLQAGATAAAILREGRRDALIVVGRDHKPGRLSSFNRSLSVQVARRASCPVAIVGLLDEPARGPSAGRVVVGVHTTGEPAAVLGFAFRAAQRRGVGITAIHARMPWGPVELDAHVHDPAAGESFRCGTVGDAMRICREAFPDVDVRHRLTAAPAGPALVAESPGAALVVLGTRAQGRLHRALSESVEDTVLRSARSPVAVVRT